ncbi:MAG: cbb3-type cytochrome c oxidase N-terminal domain-containing protein [Ferruginibacter sp.]
MFLQNCTIKKISVTALALLSSFTMLSQDPQVVKTVQPGNNLLAILIIIIAFVLAFVIWGMGQVLITMSRQLLDKNKIISKSTVFFSLTIILSLASQNILAQDPVTKEIENAIPNYGGLSATTFYSLMAVVATETVAILFLFFSIRRIYAELVPGKTATILKEPKLIALWKKLNKKLTRAIPLEQEADALLDHDYDGIRELDNALPPWWKYGFIVTIGFALVYLLNFHVLGNGKNPVQEYALEMDNAKIEKEAFEAKNKDKIDESNVPMANVSGVQQGKEFFMANCVACHGTNGEGGAGPNLTDDYWLHKGSLNDIYNTIKKGFPDKGMQSWAVKFNPKEISLLASYVTTLKGTRPPGAKAPQGELFIPASDTSSLKISKPDDQVSVK